MKKYLFICIALLISLTAAAERVSEVRALIDSCRYSQAYAVLGELTADEAYADRLGTLNALAGEIDYLTSNYDAAREHLATAREHGVADAFLWTARLSLLDYDLKGAAANVEKYMQLRKKAKKDTSDGRLMQQRIDDFRDMLTHVEKITVIDSLAVDKEDFFRAYRIPSSQGRILAAEDDAIKEIESNFPALAPMTLYRTENGDRMLMPLPASGEDGRLTALYEVNRLADGSWDEPQPLEIEDERGLMNAFPWLTTDGVTLYYSSYSQTDGLGGYDIYMSTVNPADGTFRAPTNLGMPYNSAANDYLLAIDEENNVGWWATDRNSEPGQVTVYTFIPNEIRVNYDPDEDDTIAYGRIADWRATIEGDAAEYDELLERISHIDPEASQRAADFELQITPRLVYRYFDDFQSHEAARLMQEYLDAADDAALAESQLMTLRRKWHDGDNSKRLADQITSLELRRDKAAAKARSLRGKVIDKERKTL